MHKGVIEGGKDVSDTKDVLSFGDLRSKLHLDLFFLCLSFTRSHVWNKRKYINSTVYKTMRNSEKPKVEKTNGHIPWLKCFIFNENDHIVRTEMNHREDLNKARINPFTVICAMFLTGQNCLFRTLVAVCDPAFELHAHVSSAREVRAPGRRQQRVFEINNFAPSKTWRILPWKFFLNISQKRQCNCKFQYLYYLRLFQFYWICSRQCTLIFTLCSLHSTRP